MMNNIKSKSYISVFIFISAFFLFTSTTFAATEVYFTKEISQIKKGDTFSVDLKISSEKKINVVDGVITYDKNKLEIKKVDKTNSILFLWVMEPVFDNKKGELSLIGGVPNGYSDKNGQILRITFLAKNDGETVLGFKDIFSILANDGLGTNISAWFEPMHINIEKKQANYLYNYILGIILIVLSAIILIKKRNDK